MSAVRSSLIILLVLFIQLAHTFVFPDKAYGAENAKAADADCDELQTILNKDPYNASAHLLLAVYYNKHGMLSAAAEENMLALKYAPEEPHALLEATKVAIEHGNLSFASFALHKLEASYPDDPYVLYLKGTSLFGLHRLAEADLALTSAYTKNPNVPGLTAALSVIRLGQKQCDEAWQLADAALRQDPGSYMAYAVKGTALAILGRHEEAVAPLTVAFSVSPLGSGLADNLSLCLMHSGKLNEAMRPSLYYLALKGLDSKIRLLEIMSSIPQDQSKEAIEQVAKQINTTPLAADFHFALGDIYDHLNHPQLAIEQYRAGLKINPEFARGYLRLGEDLEIWSLNYDEALSCYRNAFIRKPSDPEILGRYNRLANRLPMRNKDMVWKLRDWLTTKTREVKPT